MLGPFTLQLAGIRGFEWIIIGAIILSLFFGAKKIPELARSFGRASGEFEKARLKRAKKLKGRKVQTLEKDTSSSQ